MVNKKLQENNLLRLNIVLSSLSLAFIGWLIKAIIDSILLYNRPFLQVFLTDIPISEIYIRFFVSICFFIFGYILTKNYYQKKQAYDEIKKLNEDLEKKVKDRTKKIESFLEKKNQLIINLGHDFRTPLTPLMGLLPSIIKKEKDPKLKNLLEISLENVRYLSEMVNKSIDIARYDAGLVELKKQKAFLYDEIKKVVENNEYLLKKKNILIENNVDTNLKINIDKLRIREVFNNLLKNSVDCSNKNEGLILIDAEISDDDLIISITDNGQGLEKEEIDQVFDELYKADKSRHDLKTNGLGLSICKRIIDKHGGKIWVESPGLDRGTTVYFSLPLKK